MKQHDDENLVFHENFNFSDGNIVIRAVGSLGTGERDPQPPTCFRIHKSVIKAQSSAFSDMIDLCGSGSPASTEPEMQFQGLPMLDLYDDATNLERLMDALYMSMWALHLSLRLIIEY